NEGPGTMRCRAPRAGLDPAGDAVGDGAALRPGPPGGGAAPGPSGRGRNRAGPGGPVPPAVHPGCNSLTRQWPSRQESSSWTVAAAVAATAALEPSDSVTVWAGVTISASSRAVPCGVGPATT